MKKITVLICSVFFIIGCKSPSSKSKQYTVTYRVNGVDTLDPKKYSDGDTVTVKYMSTTPVCENGRSKKFKYWYDGQNTYNNSWFIISSNVLLEAKFDEVVCQLGCDAVTGSCVTCECMSDGECAGRPDGKIKCNLATNYCEYPEDPCEGVTCIEEHGSAVCMSGHCVVTQCMSGYELLENECVKLP